MKAKVQRWGNSLGVRIPKAFAAEIGIEESTPIEISLGEGGLLLTPLRPGPAPTLDELLAGVTDANVHREVEAGPPVGDEVW